MNSRCLYCDKRLSLFHGKKKPFCSDEHEDLHLARVALSGLDRLRDDILDSGPVRPPKPSLEPPLMPSMELAPKPAEQFSYPEIEPGFFDDDFEPAPRPAPPRAPEGIFNRPRQRSADGIPPVAEYLISGANGVQPAPPTIPFRNPARAAFSAIEWVRPIVFEGSRDDFSAASVRSSPPLAVEAGTPPPLVTSLERLPMPLFTRANLPVKLDLSKISAMCAELSCSLPRLEAQPAEVTVDTPAPETPAVEIPVLSTAFAAVDIAAVRLADPITSRTFRDFTLNTAVPKLIYPPPHRAPKFESQAQPTEAPPIILTPQVLEAEPLPQPQPLRFRTLLDLRGSAFQTFAHRLARAPLAQLSWNASPPETPIRQLSMVRRRPSPLLPNLTHSQAL